MDKDAQAGRLGGWHRTALTQARSGVDAHGLFGLERRRLTTKDGEIVSYEIGTLLAPENRSDPHSRLIGIGFARIPSSLAAASLPTFHLVGGPGASHLGALEPGDDAERLKQRDLLSYRSVGDVVIIDQRGYSARGEILTFTAHQPGQPLDRPANQAERTAAFIEAAHRAVEAHADKDLAGYNILDCADDVDDLRRALGYGQIHLVGQSFGSQWALAFMRRHPGVAARATLSGVEPLDKVYDMPSEVFAALQRIAWEADHAPALAPFLPPGGLMGALATVRERFEQGPVQVEVQGEAGGPPQRVCLGLGDFQRSLLRPATVWPAHVLSLYHGKYDQWAREVAGERSRGHPNAPLIGPLIDTSLGVTPAREHRLRTDPAGSIIGWWDFASYCASAPVWPSPDVGDAFRAPVPDPTPVVFMCGDWDTATPIENMLGLVPYFPNARAIIVRRGPHAARAMLAEAGAPVIAAIRDFLRTGDLDGLPAEVSLPAPAFEVPAFPAPGPRGGPRSSDRSDIV